MAVNGSAGDPIVAIATAAGRGAVGIVRLSGDDLHGVIDAVCRRRLAPRRATYLPFVDAAGGSIDRGLAIHFPAPHSYTGEDVLELQAHGGPVVLQLLLARCLEAGAGIGLRLALPGEFTQRAYLNGKLDLAQAEAVGDLIDASTEAAARSAGRSLGGAFSARVREALDQLVVLRSLVEATLDFPEEEIDFLEKAGARGRLDRLALQLAQVLDGARQGALLRDGIKVVIAGQPNVGKSSLLNALAGAELAIVTPIPGTTRDTISQTIQIDGVPVHVVDTAGIRDLESPGESGRADAAAEAVERIGIARSWDEIAGADALLFLHDLTRWLPGLPSGTIGAGAEPSAGVNATVAAHRAADAAIAARLPAALCETAGRLLHVFNKLDAVTVTNARDVAGPALVHEQQPLPVLHPAEALPADSLCVSALTGAGLPALRQRLLALAGWHAQPEGAFIARARHVDALRRTQQHLRQAIDHAAQADAALELLAEELRLAQRTLGEITGAFTPDDLLGQIFSRFCIGK